MSPRPICGALYRRTNGDELRCTFPARHGVSEHSWAGIRCADIEDAEKTDYTPQAVQAFLDSMARGEMDDYIEAILAVGHNRKRAKRGVAGFKDGGTTR